MGIRRCHLCVAAIIMSVLMLWGLAALLTPEGASALGQVHYVAPGASCGSQSPCYPVIQAAVDAAQSGDEIRVAGGVYTDINHYAGLAQVVYVSRTLTLRGGYSTEDWEHSFPLTRPTILDAQMAGRVLYAVGPVSLTIENMSFVNGDATGLGGTYRFGGYSAGGGFYGLSATVFVSNTTWSGNLAQVGSAIYAESGKFSLFYSTVISNAPAILGGGLFLEEGDNLLVDNAIANNTASYGGGLSVCGGSTELMANQIVFNQGGSHGGGVQCVDADCFLAQNVISGNAADHGGGASLSGNCVLLENTVSQNSGSWGAGIAQSDGVLSLIGNSITENEATYLGGGVAINESTCSPPSDQDIISNNVITGNQAPWGGGLWMQCARARSMDNLFQGNQATETGGGLYLNYSELASDGDMIVGNTAESFGGGLAILQYHGSNIRNAVLSGNQATSGGSALFVDDSRVHLLHTTIVGASTGSGVYVRSPVLYSSQAFVVMTNTIVVSYSVGITATSSSTVTIDGMLCFGNGVNTGGPGAFSVSHSVEGDPAFAPDGFHLGPASAALDNGVPSGIYYDIDHEPRPSASVDLGADEYWPEGALSRVYLPLVSRCNSPSGAWY